MKDQYHAIRRARTLRAFTLVEVMAVVTIVGVLSALSVYGVGKYVRASKTAEAEVAVGRMAKDASSAYDRESEEGELLKSKRKTKPSHRLCTSASRGVPRNVKKVKGSRYQSSRSEWNRDAKKRGKGFACLGFTMQGSQWYQYRYKTNRNNYRSTWKAGTTFKAFAVGDLDGDGVRSEISLSGKIVQAKSGLALVVAPALTMTNPEE